MKKFNSITDYLTCLDEELKSLSERERDSFLSDIKEGFEESVQEKVNVGIANNLATEEALQELENPHDLAMALIADSKEPNTSFTPNRSKQLPVSFMVIILCEVDLLDPVTSHDFYGNLLAIIIGVIGVGWGYIHLNKMNKQQHKVLVGLNTLYRTQIILYIPLILVVFWWHYANHGDVTLFQIIYTVLLLLFTCALHVHAKFSYKKH